jgi:reductive dehalogenase
MVASIFNTLLKMGAPDFVDGNPVVEKVKISPEPAVVKVKNLARLLGADLIGISEMKSEYAFSHRGRQKYPDEEPWGMPIEVDHHYAISLGFKEDYNMIATGPQSSEMIESSAVYLKSAVVSVALAEYIRELGYPARAHHFRNYQVLPVPLAVEAGLGELGRCGFLVTRKYGNCIRLSTVTTDLPLVTDNPIDIGMQDFCEHCKLCAEACPSGAISKDDKIVVRGAKKWGIDDVKCYEFWNKVGTDCGVCIGSCPWTEPDNFLHRTSAFIASKSKFARRFLLWIYPLIYGKYQPSPKPEWLDDDKKEVTR